MTEITIECEGRRFFVEEALLRKESAVISRMFEHDTLERNTRIIRHQLYGNEVVDRMAEWLTKKDYIVAEEADLGPLVSTRSPEEADAEQSQPLNSILMDHVDVDCIADFYEMPNLRYVVHQKFMRACRYGLVARGFSQPVKKIYNNTHDSSPNRDLRDILHEYAFQNRAKLMNLTYELSTDPDLQAFLVAVFQRTLRGEALDRREYVESKQRKNEDWLLLAASQGRIAHGIARESLVLKTLVEAIPSFPRQCAEDDCRAEFPGNLKVTREQYPLPRTPNQHQGGLAHRTCCWVISCSQCKQEVHREVQS